MSDFPLGCGRILLPISQNEECGLDFNEHDWRSSEPVLFLCHFFHQTRFLLQSFRLLRLINLHIVDIVSENRGLAPEAVELSLIHG